MDEFKGHNEVIGFDTASDRSGITNISVRFKTPEGGHGVVSFEGHSCKSAFKLWAEREVNYDTMPIAVFHFITGRDKS